MATFQVPQFIEEKAKIVGPLTLEQFFYLGGAAGLSILAFYIFDFFLFILIAVASGAVGISFAFVEINGERLPKLIISAIQFWQKPKTFIWQRETPTTTIDVSSLEKIKELRRGMSLEERIKNAALSITTGKIPFFGGAKAPKPKEQYQTVTFITGERGIAKRVDYLKEKQ